MIPTRQKLDNAARRRDIEVIAFIFNRITYTQAAQSFPNFRKIKTK